MSTPFRIRPRDLIKRTSVLWNPDSPVNVYGRWRKRVIGDHLLRFYQHNPSFPPTFLDDHPGKIDRIALLLEYLNAQDCRGDVAEFGVYRGYTAMAMARFLLKHRPSVKLHLFDSFQGFPPSVHPMDDHWHEGSLSFPAEEAVKLFHGFPNVILYPGFFSDTLPAAEELQLSFCHIDCDLYTSTRDVLDYLYDRLLPSGTIMLDDYGMPLCEGARAAVDECSWIGSSRVVQMPTGQGVYHHR